MISTLNCKGGRWVPARVLSLHYRQEGWCPDFFCPYTVRIEGNARETIVREDDPACIRGTPTAPHHAVAATGLGKTARAGSMGQAPPPAAAASGTDYPPPTALPQFVVSAPVAQDNEASSRIAPTTHIAAAPPTMSATSKKKAGVESVARLCCNTGCEETGANKRCDRCQRVVYCSRRCQKLHWTNGGHKRHCIPASKRGTPAAAAATPPAAGSEAAPPSTTFLGVPVRARSTKQPTAPVGQPAVARNWGDGEGLEAAYELLVGGKLDIAIDHETLTEALAVCKSESERRAKMLHLITSTAEQATESHILTGKRVRVRGLESRGDLNGKVGVAVRFSEERDRYEVKIDQGALLFVRGVNLELAKLPMVTCPICFETEMTDPLGPSMTGPENGCATVTSCCGQTICTECEERYLETDAVQNRADLFPPCPFCRQPFGLQPFSPTANNKKTKEQLKRRASQASAVACYNLSGSYDRAQHGLPRDFVASAAWAALAAMAGGHVRAMNNLGFAFRLGEGVERNDVKALPWLLRAAESGHVGSGWAVGKAHRDGRGTATDVAAAAKWFRRGAETGDDACIHDLLRLPPPYGKGAGVCPGALNVDGAGNTLDRGEIWPPIGRAPR